MSIDTDLNPKNLIQIMLVSKKNWDIVADMIQGIIKKKEAEDEEASPATRSSYLNHLVNYIYCTLKAKVEGIEKLNIVKLNCATVNRGIVSMHGQIYVYIFRQ